MRDSLERGIQDGSIRCKEEPEQLLLTLNHGCIAMAQRVLPREKIFRWEHGYGRELLYCEVRLLMEAIRAV